MSTLYRARQQRVLFSKKSVRIAKLTWHLHLNKVHSITRLDEGRSGSGAEKRKKNIERRIAEGSVAFLPTRSRIANRRCAACSKLRAAFCSFAFLSAAIHAVQTYLFFSLTLFHAGTSYFNRAIDAINFPFCPLEASNVAKRRRYTSRAPLSLSSREDEEDCAMPWKTFETRKWCHSVCPRPWDVSR